MLGRPPPSNLLRQFITGDIAKPPKNNVSDLSQSLAHLSHPDPLSIAHSTARFGGPNSIANEETFFVPMGYAVCPHEQISREELAILDSKCDGLKHFSPEAITVIVLDHASTESLRSING